VPLPSSRPARTVGLVLLGLLSLGDVALPALTDGETPPYAVAAAAAVLGLVSLWLVIRALRDPSAPVRLLIGLRVLSAVLALPAFLTDDVPTGAVVGAAAGVVLTAIGVLLVASGARVTSADAR
jgi:hypothetical protein